MNRLGFVALACALAAACGSPAPQPDAGTPDCTTYCNALIANCTGAHQQFISADRCQASCLAMPVGTTADTSGNTLGCRIYHANAAKSDPATNCRHAGPGGAGVCGADCDGYCQIAMKYCVGDAGIYPSASQCQTTCAKFPDDAGYNVTDTSLQAVGQVACLLYHVQEASIAPMDHCLGDLAPDPANHNSSTTCNNGPDAGP